MSRRVTAFGLVAGLCLTGTFVYTQTQTQKTRTTATAADQAKMAMVKKPTTDAEKIASAKSAAPAAVANAATVLDMGADGKMKTLKAGTNGWTCLPDMPTTPGTDPMCVDKNGVDWLHAWMGHTNPPAGKMAIGYMLMGGSDASNTDPFATAPRQGGQWIDTGPHMMVMNIGTAFDGYPTVATDTKVPYVMFPGTPYAHLMIPVR